MISVENLGKKYRIQHQAQVGRYLTLRDAITERARPGPGTARARAR